MIFFFITPEFSPCVTGEENLGKTELNVKVVPNRKLETQIRLGSNQNELDLNIELLSLIWADNSCLVFISRRRYFSCVIDG